MKINKTAIPILILLCWFSFFWSWSFATDSISLAGSHLQGIVLKVIVMFANVSISFLIAWQTYKWLVKLYDNKNPYLATLIALPILALADFLVAWLVAFFWIGPEGTVSSVLPLASPSILLINTPLGFSSRLIGFYGMAAFFWLILFLLTRKKCRHIALILFISLSLISFTGALLYKNVNGSELRTIIISETIDDRNEPIKSDTADLIVFPEYGLHKINNDNLKDRLISSDKQQYFVGSDQVKPEGSTRYYNRMLFGEGEKGMLQEQYKHRMIPGGEDLPYIMKGILLGLKQNSVIEYFDVSKYIVKGPNQLEPIQINDQLVLGSALCSSIISPEDYRELANNGSTILTNSASLSTFSGSSLFTWQQKSLGKFMAIANSRYFVQSANASTAYAIDNNGNVIEEIKDINMKEISVFNNSKKTPYTIFGEALVVSGALIVIMLFANKAYRLKDSKPKRRNNR